MFLISIFILKLSFATLVEYKLWKNYGELFYDYSGNSGTGINGLSTSDSYQNTFFTDRGAYFTSRSLIFVGNKNYQNPNTVIMWLNVNQALGRFFTYYTPNYGIFISFEPWVSLIWYENNINNLIVSSEAYITSKF